MNNTENPKYIRYASDLHIGAWKDAPVVDVMNKFLPFDMRDEQSILVLAGDITSNLFQLAEFLTYVEQRFKYAVYIPGNHEFYGSEMKLWTQAAEDVLHSTLHKTAWIIDGVASAEIYQCAFVYGTLWGYGAKPNDKLITETMINDFQFIRLNGEKMTTGLMGNLNSHHHSQFVNQLLKYSDRKHVIAVSHHLPSEKGCHPRFLNRLNGAFASNSDDLLNAEASPGLWIHGHTHDTIDMVIGRTRVVANPHGYPNEVNMSKFNTYAPRFVEIDLIRPVDI